VREEFSTEIKAQNMKEIGRRLEEKLFEEKFPKIYTQPKMRNGENKKKFEKKIKEKKIFVIPIIIWRFTSTTKKTKNNS
jgi:hypothetical protein